MPLEMFDGKTGRRLIARAPTDPNQLATVTFRDGNWIQVHAPSELMRDGYPGLSPVIETLPVEVANMILVNVADALKISIDQWRPYATDLENLEAIPEADRTPMETRTMEHAQQLRRLHEARNRRITRPPVLTSVGPGRKLYVRLATSIFGNKAVYDLGIIQDITIP